MRFEFDGAKSAANKVKHGIDVVEAQALWNVVGQIGETIWTATVTYRHEETIRIISVRRARANEKARYLKGQGEMGHS
jgi:uncharacterized DUF497 family protein